MTGTANVTSAIIFVDTVANAANVAIAATVGSAPTYTTAAIATAALTADPATDAGAGKAAGGAELAAPVSDAVAGPPPPALRDYPQRRLCRRRGNQGVEASAVTVTAGPLLSSLGRPPHALICKGRARRRALPLQRQRDGRRHR